MDLCHGNTIIHKCINCLIFKVKGVAWSRFIDRIFGMVVDTNISDMPFIRG